MNSATQQTAPQTVTPTAPAATPVTHPTIEAPTQQQDLLKRVAQPATSPTPPNESPKVSVSMDDIKDPIARQLLEKRLAEANESISKTFGQVGADKAKLMKQVEDLQSKINQNWTPQRLQQELSRQDFVQAAQALQAQAPPNGWEGSPAEWSSLTQSEKQQFQNIVASQQTLTQQMNHMLQSQIDSQLKTQYPDYDPTQVDSFYRESAEGRVAPDRIREMIHKALNYESHTRRAYELGQQDKANLNQERVQGMTTQTTPATISPNKPERLAGETAQHWLSKVTKWNLERVSFQRSSPRT